MKELGNDVGSGFDFSSDSGQANVCNSQKLPIQVQAVSETQTRYSVWTEHCSKLLKKIHKIVQCVEIRNISTKLWIAPGLDFISLL